MATEPATSSEARAACVHCGLGLREREVRFCCVGCHLAYHLLDRDEPGDGRPSDRLLARLVVSAFLAMGVMVFSLSLYGVEGEVTDDSARAMQGLARMGALALSVPILGLLGVPLLQAVIDLKRRLTSESLVLLGIGAAWTVSVVNTFREGGSVYFDTATMVLVLFCLGRWLDVRARESARARLELLVEERVRPALQLVGDAERERAVEELSVGDRVLVRPGETIPVDGVVVEGRAFVEAAALTGESQPRSARVGDRVWAGARPTDGALTVEATAVGGARLRDEIECVLRDAGSRRSRLVGVADRVAAGFIPVVALVAVATAWFHGTRSGGEAALMHGLSVLLIACPCALGLATPLAFWVALGVAWREGVLVRGGDVLERLARARRVIFDKTGTLTSGALELEAVEVLAELSEDECLTLAAAVERRSEHPVGRAIVAAWRACENGSLPRADDFRVFPGLGVGARVGGTDVRLVRAVTDVDERRTAVSLERDGRALARFVLSDAIRAEAARAVADLRAAGLEVSAMTGDSRGAARRVAEALDIEVMSELLPQQKLEHLERAGSRGSVFVGDGLNDAPVLTAADVGVSMRSSSAESLESASINLMKNDLSLVPRSLRLARDAVRTAHVNLAWAFGYNAVGVGLAAAGRLTPVFAACAMIASSLLVVFHSARLARRGGDPRPAPLSRTDDARALQGAH